MQSGKSEQFRTERLRVDHDRQNFCCGVVSLDKYFKTQAGQDLRNKLAVTFVLLKGQNIAGYYTLSNASIALSDLPKAIQKKLPKYPSVPATLIGRLARDEKFKAQGIGEILLLVDALKRSYMLSRQMGSFAVLVDAENTQAKQFYLKYNFIPFNDFPNRLYLPMATIEKLGLFN